MVDLPTPTRRRFLAGAAVSPFMPPAVPAAANGRASDVSWSFYRAGSDTPALVFANAALTHPFGTRVSAAAGGGFPPIFLDPATTYRAVLQVGGNASAVLDPVEHLSAGSLPYSPTDAPIFTRSIADRLRDALSVKDFGAIGDGRFHALSERFASLDAARRAYPFVVSLDQSIDWAATTAAINAVEEARGRVLLPRGRYILSDSIRLPSFVEIMGEGPGISIFDNQNWPLATPLVVNKDPQALVAATLRHLSLHGGTHGMRLSVTAETAGITLDHVTFALQTDKNFECNKLLQLAEFNRCVFGRAPYGLFVAGWTTNMVNFTNCSFEDHSNAHLYLRSAEAVNVIGGRFEGGGQLGPQATIDLEEAKSINFIGVYFEATHELLLKETKSRNGVTFDGCHFTGAKGEAGLIPYRFESDGYVGFGTNDWGRDMQGPTRMLRRGENALLSDRESRVMYPGSPRSGHIVYETVPFRGEDVPLLTITRNSSPQSDQAQTLSGELVLNYAGRTGGGAPRLGSARYAVVVLAGAGPIRASISAIHGLWEMAGGNVTVRERADSSGNSVKIEAVITGVPPNETHSAMNWEFRWLSASGSDAGMLRVELGHGERR